MVQTQNLELMKKNLIPIAALLLCFTSGCILAQKNTDQEKNKDFLKAYTEDYWNNHNMAAFDKYFSSDFTCHTAEADMNREQYMGLCHAYFNDFPDLHITTHDLIAEGDKVVKVWTAKGTHKGDLMGIPATGNSINVYGMEVFRIKDGKIAELWISMDNLGMLQQLGVIPPLGE